MAKSPTGYIKYVPVSNVVGANRLMVKAYYDKGGINYFNYETDPRGYYASVTPVTVTDATEPGGFSSVAYNLFKSGGFKVFLQPTQRFNGKALRDLAIKILMRTGDLGAAFDRGEPNVAYEILAGFKDPALTKEVA